MKNEQGASTRQRILIASSKEALPAARAVQQNLEPQFETTVWDQNIFKLSTFALESLLRSLGQVDYGIAVLSADDFTRSRGKVFNAPRDNVVLELGMMLGRLGPRRTFVIAPTLLLKLPSDLLGWTIALYDPSRVDKNVTSAVAPACHKIRDEITSRRGRPVAGLLETSTFSGLSNRLLELIGQAQEITVCFIHSRRWREMHDRQLNEFLAKTNAVLRVFLPDLRNKALRTMICEHFEDGPEIPRFVADAYRYFADLKKKFPRRVQVRLFCLYPTYSYYRFDNKVIVAMYPITRRKADVPAFELSEGDALYEFFEENMKQQLLDLAEVPAAELEVRVSELRKL